MVLGCRATAFNIRSLVPSLSNLFWVIAAQGSLYPRWTDTHSQGKCNPRPFFRRPIVFLR